MDTDTKLGRGEDGAVPSAAEGAEPVTPAKPAEEETSTAPPLETGAVAEAVEAALEPTAEPEAPAVPAEPAGTPDDAAATSAAVAETLAPPAAEPEAPATQAPPSAAATEPAPVDRGAGRGPGLSSGLVEELMNLGRKE